MAKKSAARRKKNINVSTKQIQEVLSTLDNEEHKSHAEKLGLAMTVKAAVPITRKKTPSKSKVSRSVAARKAAGKLDKAAQKALFGKSGIVQFAIGGGRQLNVPASCAARIAPELHGADVLHARRMATLRSRSARSETSATIISTCKLPKNSKLYNLSGYYLRDSVVIPNFTSNMACDLYAVHGFQFNRKLKTPWVQCLAKSIECLSGLKIAVLPNGQVFLVDGQHRIAGMLAAGISKIRASIEVYCCKDEEALANLFAVVGYTSPRTAGQNIDAALRTGAVVAPGISPAFIATCTQHARFARNSESAEFIRVHKALRGPELLAYVMKYNIADYAIWLHRQLKAAADASGSTVNKIKQKYIPHSVGACMYSMWSSNQRVGQQFVRKYLLGDDCVGKNQLFCYIRKIFENIDRKASHSDAVATSYVQMLWSAWYAFRKGTASAKTGNHDIRTDVPSFDKWSRLKAK